MDDFEPAHPELEDYLKRYRAQVATPMSPEEAALEAAKGAPVPPTGKAESFLSKAAESVPIIGAPYNKAVAALESVSPFFSSRHLERGEGEYQPKTQGEALAAQQALMAQRAEEHPGFTTAGKIAGGIAGYAALPGASMASLPASMATTGVVSGLDEAARGGDLRQSLGAAAGGAAGGALGYGVGKVLTKALGKLADWQAIRAMGGTTAPAFKNIANVSKNLQLEEGGLARVAREQGIVGGLKKLPDVAEAAGAAGADVGEQFGNLISKADAGGGLIPVSNILDRVGTIATKGIRPKYLDTALKEAKDELGELAGPGGALTHGQLQEWLSQRAGEASGIASDLAKKANVSAADRAFHAIYKAGRDVQDEGLATALGESGMGARDLRRLMALNRVVEGVAQNRGQMLASQNPIGLLGTIGGVSGLHQITQGNLGVGIPLLALSLGGKATQPYRANVLTSLLSGTQGGLQRLGAGETAGLPTILGADVGSAGGAKAARKKVVPIEDDFEPVGAPTQVAGRPP